MAVAGEVNVQATGEVPSGSATGKWSAECGRTLDRKESVTWYPVGTKGHESCFKIEAGGCQVQNCGKALPDICSEWFPEYCKNGRCEGCEPENQTYFKCNGN